MWCSKKTATRETRLSDRIIHAFNNYVHTKCACPCIGGDDQYTHTAPLTDQTDIWGIIIPTAKQSATSTHKCFQFSLSFILPVIHGQCLIPGQSHYVPVSIWNCAHVTEKLLSAIDYCPQGVTVSNSNQAFRISWQSCFPSHRSYSVEMIIQSLHLPARSLNRLLLCHPQHQTITS